MIQLNIRGEMAEWLWRVTQALLVRLLELCVLIGLSCVGSNPTLIIIFSISGNDLIGCTDYRDTSFESAYVERLLR